MSTISREDWTEADPERDFAESHRRVARKVRHRWRCWVGSARDGGVMLHDMSYKRVRALRTSQMEAATLTTETARDASA